MAFDEVMAVLKRHSGFEMFSMEEETVISLPGLTIYPEQRKIYRDRQEIRVGVWTKNWISTDSERSWIAMYSQDKINIALQVYHQCGSVTNTIRMLGYPTRRALYTWIENGGVQKTPRKVLDNTNTTTHPRNPPVEVKMDAIHRCFGLGESIKSVSEEIGYSREASMPGGKNISREARSH